jgi:hypothetical protein
MSVITGVYDKRSLNKFYINNKTGSRLAMLLIYTHITSARLQYITHFIFGTLQGITYRITVDPEEFTQYNGPKINYSDAALTANELWIQNTALLFAHDIQPQTIECFDVDGQKAFFKTTGHYPFDIFAAAFYLLSRYEEYLPHAKDSYGRFAHEESLACKEGFLHLPLINMWVQQLGLLLQQTFTGYQPNPPAFSFEPTYDIDTAYSYLYKGLWRNMGRVLRLPHTLFDRIAVLSGRKKDHFDCYNWLHQLHKKHGLQPVYFFLVAEKSSRYDKHILPHKDAMWRLVKKHADHYTIGLHPSWQSGDKPHLLAGEKRQLEAMAEKPVTHSRQHYIRFALPDGYTRLIDHGIAVDYSMGYGSINGFRASVATPFYWFNLQENETTSLLLHPFCFMEANSFYEQRYTPAQALQEMQHYLTVCKQVNGTLCTIWHNNFLGTDPVFAGWRNVYEEFIALATAQ